jgi:hypothetical protein
LPDVSIWFTTVRATRVNVYRFVTKDTVEEDVLERARKKMILEYASMFPLVLRPRGRLSLPEVLARRVHLVHDCSSDP